MFAADGAGSILLMPRNAQVEFVRVGQNGWTLVRCSNGSKNWLDTNCIVFVRPRDGQAVLPFDGRYHGDVWRYQDATPAAQPWEMPRDDDVWGHDGWERAGGGDPMTIAAGLKVTSMTVSQSPPAPR